MQALPSRYEVERRGTPDPPNCDYYVLDAVHEYEARYILWMYVNALRKRGNTTKADEIAAGLTASKDAHEKAMSANNPPPKTKKTPERPMPAGAVDDVVAITEKEATT